ncbi:TonB-dependent receptor [Maribellus maritimus]|uniref:TonB-dependent receptor n=1 Tax=Maribellus maritimus TaxID=2870838 RepID=UPI001EE9D485|nr:TonB-dependent receptor [Maribellus maritimus]MCG6191136.1 TonB-dependent receptor [Maribellus maritimus]
MKCLTCYLIVFLVVISIDVKSQNLTQTVRGSILDKISQTPLPGSTVMISGTNPLLGTTTNSEGDFRIENVPLGRYNLEIRSVGYATITLPEVLVGSGKEVVLNIEMTESVIGLGEVVIKAHADKSKPMNSMASVSARSFNVEETRRYAGGIDDPARLVTAFAGVSSGGNTQDNAIVIRGNPPKTVLWRIEGVDVVNPGHFSGGNVAGGSFTSIISSQMLSNSDFYTGAFPAEYGNVLGGVFDIKLRQGNNEKHEKTIQAGVMGLDFSAEGPFKKGGKSSYLFNYRYSTLGLLSKLSIIPTDQTPIYQDLSFKLVFPTPKAGVFTFWGMGGIDYMIDGEESDSTQWETDYDRIKNRWDESFGAVGFNNKYSLSFKTYIHTSVAATGNFKELVQQRLNDTLALQNDMDLNLNTGKISLNSFVNHKFNPRLNTRSGFNLNTLLYKYNLNGTESENPDTYRNYVNKSGKSYHIQAFTQMKYYLSDALSFNAGVQAEYFALTGKFAIDPRFAVNWDFSPSQSISLGYGKHSQLEDLNVYFIKTEANGQMNYTNQELDFSHAHHFVLGYNYRINENLRLKIEPYYQYLYNVPGIEGSSFSMINFKQDLTFQSVLANNSVATNLGIDITLERFLKNNFYYLFTASAFDSKYKADDGVWRDTRYNKHFVANFLAGKEFSIGKNNNLLGVNLRGVISGGEYYTPLNKAASLAAGFPVYDEPNAFSEQDGISKFVNLTVTYRINKARYSSVFSLQINNLLGEAQYDKYEYNYKEKDFVRASTVYTLPVISYKIEF